MTSPHPRLRQRRPLGRQVIVLKRQLGALLVALGGGAVCLPAAAQAQAEAPRPALFQGADIALGQQLLKTHRCHECHAQRVGGDGNAIYRPQGRINTPALLRSMVDRCDAELGLQLFPEDVLAIAAALNREHYRFR